VSITAATETGELGICGAGASIANAVDNASGIRIRDYPQFGTPGAERWLTYGPERHRAERGAGAKAMWAGYERRRWSWRPWF